MIINVAEWMGLNKAEKMQMILDAAILNYRKLKSSNQ